MLEVDAKDAVREFWIKSGLDPCKDFYEDPKGEHRCGVCAKTFKRAQDLKAHKTRQNHHKNDEMKLTPIAKKDSNKAKY